ncbi:MAG: hypothetical protein MRJ93_14075 [Nitrososphaeraceae archaeon]|nr:hypothetical protein [Nitrososphaeraceae archaeon]
MFLQEHKPKCSCEPVEPEEQTCEACFRQFLTEPQLSSLETALSVGLDLPRAEVTVNNLGKLCVALGGETSFENLRLDVLFVLQQASINLPDETQMDLIECIANVFDIPIPP